MKRISEAALSLIAKNGYESTSISQIATEAGISKGLLYNYYESKEALLESLVLGAMSEGDQIMESMVSEDPAATLEKLIRWFFNEMRERPDHWRLITEVILKIDKHKFVNDITAEKIQAYVNVMQHLFAQMEYEDPMGEARMLAALFDGIAIQAIVIKEDYPLNELEKTLIRKYCKRK
ncbi:MAG: TetR/AcrR family transcriptional regulator [Bacteroidetes bacterium]|nr:TetR/AcrR family transcriptional regulator [Bacteroidota bacterium]